MRKSALPLILVLFAGCDSYHYHYGLFLEATHRDLKALAHYDKFAEDRPQDPRSAEINVKAGDIEARQQRCLEARRHYEAAARDFPKLEPWDHLAKAGILACPDYFPLDGGRKWTFGDSASGGKAMRLDLDTQGAADRASASIHSQLYAGDKKIRADQARYEKRDWGVWELRGSEKSLILRYPFKKGESWTTTRDGERLQYRIEADDVSVKTKAGTFAGCLKVREFNKKFPDTWKYDYFAPFVGRVKTSVAGPDYENPNTELITYTP